MQNSLSLSYLISPTLAYVKRGLKRPSIHSYHGLLRGPPPEGLTRSASPPGYCMEGLPRTEDLILEESHTVGLPGMEPASVVSACGVALRATVARGVHTCSLRSLLMLLREAVHGNGSVNPGNRIVLGT